MTAAARHYVPAAPADDDPDHWCKSRRRFVVWAVLCGFAKPERLTETVLAELEQEGERQ